MEEKIQEVTHIMRGNYGGAVDALTPVDKAMVEHAQEIAQIATGAFCDELLEKALAISTAIVNFVAELERKRSTD